MDVQCKECLEVMPRIEWDVHGCPWDIAMHDGESFDNYIARRKDARRAWEADRAKQQEQRQMTSNIQKITATPGTFTPWATIECYPCARGEKPFANNDDANSRMAKAFADDEPREGWRGVCGRCKGDVALDREDVAVCQALVRAAPGFIEMWQTGGMCVAAGVSLGCHAFRESIPVDSDCGGNRENTEPEEMEFSIVATDDEMAEGEDSTLVVSFYTRCDWIDWVQDDPQRSRCGVSIAEAVEFFEARTLQVASLWGIDDFVAPKGDKVARGKAFGELAERIYNRSKEAL